MIDIEELKKNKKVVIRGFGTFSLINRKEGKVYNGFINKEVEPSYSYRVKFTPSKLLRDKICK